jgi:hypothetical protein
LNRQAFKGDVAVKQPHTEADVAHTDDEQNTGNHKKPGTKGAGGADRLGGTRAGASNVEGDTPPDGKPTAKARP